MPRKVLEVVAVMACLVAGARFDIALGEPVRSPLGELALPENRVVRVAAVGPEGDGRFRFRPADASGEGDLVVRLDALAAAELVPGAVYIVGSSELIPVPRARRTFSRDPAGPTVVSLDGVGPALFADDPVLSALVFPSPGSTADPARQAAALAELLTRENATLRRLAATELALRPDLWPAASGAGGPLGEAFAAAQDSYTRHRLLEAARGIVGAAPAPDFAWLGEACRRAVAAAPTELDLGSYEPALLVTALDILSRAGAPADAEPIARHLDSNNPGVGKAALAALTALVPERVAALADAALARGRLDGEMRRAIEAWREQRRRPSPAATGA